MQRHQSNLSPDAQPWGRDVEVELDEAKAANGDLSSKLADVNSRYDVLLNSYNKMLYELQVLYNSSGAPYPPGPPAPPVEVPPAPVSKDIQIGAAWSRTWGTSSFYTGTGTHTNGTYLYQGSNPENKIGMFGFDFSPVRNKHIVSASLFLQNIDSPYQVGFSADFGTHNNSAAPVGKPGRINPFSVGWSRGEGKWQSLDRWALDGISNGSVTGFTIGGSGPSDANYAYFQGVGQPSPPSIKLTYNS